jgi:hypothetical protein
MAGLGRASVRGAGELQPYQFMKKNKPSAQQYQLVFHWEINLPGISIQPFSPAKTVPGIPKSGRPGKSYKTKSQSVNTRLTSKTTNTTRKTTSKTITGKTVRKRI